jgi:hypothetical protein
MGHFKYKIETDVILNFHHSKRKDKVCCCILSVCLQLFSFKTKHFLWTTGRISTKFLTLLMVKFCEMATKIALRLVLLEWRLTLEVSTKLKGTSWYTLQGVKRAALPVRGLPWTSVLKCGNLESPRGTAEFNECYLRYCTSAHTSDPRVQVRSQRWGSWIAVTDLSITRTRFIVWNNHH